MVRLVLFDIDGTLIRTGGAGVKAFETTFAEIFGIPQATRTLSFAGRTDYSLVRECFALHGIPPLDENFRRFFEGYPPRLERLLQQLDGGVCEGVDQFLAGLLRHPARPEVGLLTGNVRIGAELKLRHYKLWQHFPFGAFSDDHEDRNCIARIAVERGSERAGRQLAGEEVVVIGDTPLDIRCGESVGARVLAVGTGNYKKAELARESPAWAVDNLGEVTVEQVLSGAAAS